jgi:hypothetical protein
VILHNVSYVDKKMVQRATLEAVTGAVDACEADGATVQSVTADLGTAPCPSARLVVDYPLAGEGAPTPETATLAADDRATVGFRVPSPADWLPAEAPVTVESVAVESVAVADGALRCTHRLVFADPTDGGSGDEPATTGRTDTTPTGTSVADGEADAAKPSPESDGGTDDRTDDHEQDRPTTSTPAALGTVRDESVPAYEDDEYLRVLYESCDTFEEMSRHIEMDVVAETVRRYMVDAGVHDPDSYDTVARTGADTDDAADGGPAADTAAEPGRDADATAPGEEPLVTDGLGLPAGLQVGDLADAVTDAATVREVSRTLDLEDGRTRELLTRLGLLDLVLGRITDDHGEHGRGEVVERVRRYASS